MKKKNKIIVALLILCSFSCRSQEIKRIDILFVDSEIETPFRIDCDSFERYFKNEIDSISVQDYKSISDLTNELNNLNIADKSKYSLPDTRLKLILISNSTKIEICIDRFVVSKQGSQFLYSDTLKKLIAKEIKKSKKNA